MIHRLKVGTGHRQVWNWKMLVTAIFPFPIMFLAIAGSMDTMLDPHGPISNKHSQGHS